MGWRGTVILALLVVAVGAYVWFDQTPLEDFPGSELAPAAPRQATTPVRQLLEFSPSDVEAVRVERDGQARDAQRAGDTWSRPDVASRLDDFLHNLTTLGILMDIPAEGGNLKEFGLQPPGTVLTLRLRGRAQPLVVQIGDRNPATTGVYVRVADGPVVLAGALAAWEVDKAFAALAPAAAAN